MQRNSDIQSNSNRSHSQPTTGGWADTARERPIATAAAVGGAVAAGAFLWSQRNRIGGQVSQMSEQVSQWSDKMRSQQGSSSSEMSGRSGTPMGVETGSQPELAGAGTSSAGNAPRATGGRRGKAQTGQTMSPSRTASPTPSL